MNRHWFRAFLIVALAAMLWGVSSVAEEELTLGDVIEEIDVDAPSYGNVAWNFPVALEDMKPEFVVLANKHYLLDSKFVCEPLVKIRSMSLNKDGSKKSGDMYVVSKGMQLNEECAQALFAAFAHKE